ncbi:MAG: hypothetical protein ACNYPF_00535 [Candidatus Puniceispirillales bacterium WSBS_2018_MAG_OTU23]
MFSIKTDGSVIVEGTLIGQLDGFVFTPQISDGDEEVPVFATVRTVLDDEILSRVKAVVASADAAFKLDAKGQVFWRDQLIGKLIKGDTLYQPKAEIRNSNLLEGDQLKTVQDRLSRFAENYPKTVLEKATALTGITLTGTAREIAHQVYEALGTLPSDAVADMVKVLDDDGRRQLAMHGIRLGVDMIYMADLLKPAQIEAKALLWSIHHDHFPESGAPPASRVNINHVDGVPDAYWLAAGYRRLGGLVIRVDMAERLAAVIRAGARGGKFQISEEMMSIAGASRDQITAILLDLNYLKVEEIPSEDPEKPAIPVFERKQRKIQTNRNANNGDKSGKKPIPQKTLKKSPQKIPEKTPDPNSPFAVLAKLKNHAD